MRNFQKNVQEAQEVQEVQEVQRMFNSSISSRAQSVQMFKSSNYKQ